MAPASLFQSLGYQSLSASCLTMTTRRDGRGRGEAPPPGSGSFLALRRLRGSQLGKAVRLRAAAAAHAQTLGGPRRSEGEFKETGETRQRAPPRGRGCSHHAGDSGAAHSGGSESAGGETRLEEGKRATGLQLPGPRPSRACTQRTLAPDPSSQPRALSLYTG